MMPRTIWTGRDAWRNGFTANAADLLQIQRHFAGEETFQAILRGTMRLWAMRGARSERINSRTVEQVLDFLIHEGAR